MTHRKLLYQFLPRQGETVGVCSLVHPFLVFWEETKTRFLRETINRVVKGVAIPPLPDLLHDFGFGPGTFSLDEWFQQYQAPPLRLTVDAKSLRKLADTAEDLTRDNGLWKDNPADLESAEQDAIADLRRRLDQVRKEVAARSGPGAVRLVLAALRKQFEESARTWLSPRPWTNRLTEELLQAAQTVRSYAGPRKLWGKFLLYVRPGLASSFWLSESQRRNLERKLFPQILSAHQLRFAHERDRRKRRVAEALFGRPGVPGILDQVLLESLDQEKYFQQLAGALATPDVEPQLDAHALVTAKTLDTVLDSARKRTLGDLYQEALVKAGCSPEAFAAQLQQEGLPLNGRTYQPVEWVHVPVPAVLEALQRAGNLYLGSNNQEAPLRIEEPKSAFDAAAAITLTHPELEPLVQNLLSALVQRSKPYAEINHVTGGEPQTHALLYCYPPDRRRFERYLQTRITLANAAGPGDNHTAYQVNHPYIVTLVQFAVAAPLGGLRTLASWVHQANLLQKNGYTPLFDLTGTPEVRRLAERPEDYEDSRLLFGAACKARLFSALGSNPPIHYALTTVDPRLEILFAPVTFVPEWKTEEYFHQALGHAGFVRCLEVAFHRVADLGPTVTKLAREVDAHLVASALVGMGILEAGTSGHHFRIHWQGPPGILPPELFQKQKGALQGLTEVECIAELHRNDDLYNTVFWQVCDALDFGGVSPNDVPPFLLNFVKSL
jgi:hypothetical protein